MKTKGNLHTHTLWCDGQSGTRDMAEAALALGWTFLGYSSHAFCRHCPDFGVRVTDRPGYAAEIASLKRAYAGRLDIFTGLEIDFVDPQSGEGMDYVIGCNHYAAVGERVCEVDHTEARLLEGIRDCFDGDPMRMARGYYELEARYAREHKFDILAHFDLLTKFNEGGRIFDEESRAYRDAALSALDAVAETGVIMEVNTGAISRGCRKTPYPALFLLKRMREKNVPVLLSSDAHRADWLATYFEEGEELLRSVGYREVMALTEHGFQPMAL